VGNNGGMEAIAGDQTLSLSSLLTAARINVLIRDKTCDVVGLVQPAASILVGDPMKTSVPALAIFLALFGASAAGATTYTVDTSAGSTTIAGTITTDGTLGILTAGNIEDWDLTIDFGSPLFQESLLGPLSGNNSGVYVEGDDLSATSLQLLFNFGDTNPGVIEFAQGNNFPIFGAGWTSAGAGIGSATVTLYALGENDSPVYFTTQQDLADLPIAQTPLPASFPLFSAGVLLIGLLGRRRKRNAMTVAA
jgi:hypothetical protein